MVASWALPATPFSDSLQGRKGRIRAVRRCRIFVERSPTIVDWLLVSLLEYWEIPAILEAQNPRRAFTTRRARGRHHRTAPSGHYDKTPPKQGKFSRNLLFNVCKPLFSLLDTSNGYKNSDPCGLVNIRLALSGTSLDISFSPSQIYLQLHRPLPKH